MPTDGNEVALNTIEVAILKVFIDKKILDDKRIVVVLKDLIEKLEK